jgi:hypothetical protein
MSKFVCVYVPGKDDFISGEHVMRFPKGVRRSSDEFYVKNDDIPEVLLYIITV